MSWSTGTSSAECSLKWWLLSPSVTRTSCTRTIRRLSICSASLSCYKQKRLAKLGYFMLPAVIVILLVAMPAFKPMMIKIDPRACKIQFINKNSLNYNTLILDIGFYQVPKISRASWMPCKKRSILFLVSSSQKIVENCILASPCSLWELPS